MNTHALTCLAARAVLASAGLLAAAHLQGATLRSFESPDNSPGPLPGQDGWANTSYNNSSSFTIVTTDAIAGTQSASASPAGIGDVFRSFGESHSDLGPGNDIAVSFFIKMTQPGTSGFVVANGGTGVDGASPVFVRIDGTNIQYAGDGSPVFVNFAAGESAYIIGNTLEFKIGIDYTANTFSTSFRDVTAGTPFTAAETFPQRAADGFLIADNMHDVILVARSGTAFFDDIRLAQVPEPSVALLILGTALLAWRRRRGNGPASLRHAS